LPTSLSKIRPFRELKRVYCAGPLFNEPERREMEAIAADLRTMGFEPWVPHADGLEFAKVLPHFADQGYDPASAGRLLHEAIFALDVYQVVLGCGSLVLNINGRVPDEGAVSEAAMAWTLGKPLVIYKADARSMVAGRDNPLVAGLTGFTAVDEIRSIGGALISRIAELDLDSEIEVRCPSHVQTTACAGERLWRRLMTLGSQRPAEQVAASVVEEFGAPARQDAQPS
jgi:nucleoside 2-deoxyribosyltransferase